MPWTQDIGLSAITSGVVGGVVAWVVTRAKTEGELRKLRAQQAEDHFSHRQGNYHNLLNSERKLRETLRVTRRPEGGPAGWRTIQDEFRWYVHGVIISGTDAAAKAAGELDAAYATKPDVDFGAAERALDELVEAIRADIAPKINPPQRHGVLFGRHSGDASHS